MNAQEVNVVRFTILSQVGAASRGLTRATIQVTLKVSGFDLELKELNEQLTALVQLDYLKTVEAPLMAGLISYQITAEGRKFLDRAQ